MGSFGEDLRMERMARGIALEDITAVTKISRHHLLALEQDHFSQLPGGILSKGIVRGYVTAIGLEPQDWTDRFMKAYQASGQVLDDDRDWIAFASNVGKARMQQREAREFRIRWAGSADCCWRQWRRWGFWRCGILECGRAGGTRCCRGRMAGCQLSVFSCRFSGFSGADAQTSVDLPPRRRRSAAGDPGRTGCGQGPRQMQGLKPKSSN